MRLVVNFFNKMIVVSVMLTTIIGCSSTKKVKHSVKEVIADKRTEQTSSLTANHGDSSSLTNSTYKGTDKLFSNTIGIQYNPTFDQYGKVIPFHYEAKDAKGNNTSVSIVGPAKVINTIIDRNEETFEEILQQRKIKWNKVDSLINTLELKIDNTRKLVETEKTVAPDYLKYLIWMGFSLLVLAIILVVTFIYFKSQITKLKNLIP